jgi:hypothetical protein
MTKVSIRKAEYFSESFFLQISRPEKERAQRMRRRIPEINTFNPLLKV